MDIRITLLRAVNVSGKNIVEMASLKKILHESGFTNIQTYIQSGNIIYLSNIEPQELSAKIKSIIAQYFTLDVDVFTYTLDQWQEILNDNPYVGFKASEKNLYFTLTSAPIVQSIKATDTDKFAPDEFTVGKQVIYLNCVGGYGRTQLSNSFFEKRFQIKATTRNYNTMLKISTLANSLR